MMEVAEEVSSTSENGTKVSTCDDPTPIDPPKKAAEVPFTSLEEPIHNPEDNPVTLSDGMSKLNGEFIEDCPRTPKAAEPNHDSENVCDSISSTAENICSNEVADPSVTSSELCDGTNKPPQVSNAIQPFSISSPTISATSTSSPREHIPIVTCTKIEPKELSLSYPDLDNKEAMLLVEKLAMNSCITISRKEVKPEPAKTGTIPEGRVLRLRPTPKSESTKSSPKSSKPTDSRKNSTSSNSSSDKTTPKHSSSTKSLDKTPKSAKRKLDDIEREAYETIISKPIQYKGFKKSPSAREPAKKSILKFNPFNPAYRRDCNKAQSQGGCSNFDSSALQPEYLGLQYLGLQPLLKFKCNNCGMSTFQSLSTLNAHKAECVKSVGASDTGQPAKLPCSDQLETIQTDPKSTNIKLTRKVFLCSACGTYYELWNLFLHMREAHRRYICLQCLGMSSSPEKLSDHLKQKHGVVSQIFDDPEKFSSTILPQAFYLMCINCDKIYQEDDKFVYHKCQGKRNDNDNASSSSKIPVVSSQTQTTDLSKQSHDNQSPSSNSSRQSLRKTRDSTKKAAKLLQSKKEKEIEASNATIQKNIEIAQKSVHQRENESHKLEKSAPQKEIEDKKPLPIPQDDNIEADEAKKDEGVADVGVGDTLPAACLPETETPNPQIQDDVADQKDNEPAINDPVRDIEMKEAVKEADLEPIVEESAGNKQDLKEDEIPIPDVITESQTAPQILDERTNEELPLLPNPPDSSVAEDAMDTDASSEVPSTQEESHILNTNVNPIDAKEEQPVLPDPPIGVSVDDSVSDSNVSEITPLRSIVLFTTPPSAKKKGVRKTGRRKKPLTFKSRSRKPKRLAMPSFPLSSAGLLPNPLNSLPYPSTEASLDEPIDELEQPSEQDKLETASPEAPEAPKEQISSTSHEYSQINKLSLPPNIFKLKLNPHMDSEADSDDSQKLSLVVDESANNSDAETKSVGRKEGFDMDVDINVTANPEIGNTKDTLGPGNEITLAGDDIQPMALTLDDKIENVSIQAVLKECVRTSCLLCNYCRHAHKIAVNGKYLALHLLSEHRYMPIKNEKPEDVINKLKNSLEILESMCFNSETYDSTDPSALVPHDQDTTFDCFQCNYECGTHKDLFAHKRKFHSKPLLLCIMCKTNFFSYSEMLCHLCPGHYKAEIMFHNVHINFRCCFCKLDTIPSAFRLMVHLRKSHHTCDICLEGCSDQQKLSTHLWKHKVNHLCYRCGISYASKPDITKHLFWKHGHESVLCKKCLQKKWPHVYHFCIPPTSFICEECSATFSKAVALKVHKRLHSQEFPYTCSECEKKFISKKLLHRHEERHRNIELSRNGVNNSASTDDDQKDEIINVTDVVDAKDPENDVVKEENKDEEVKEKAHKKHKKDKKDKVVDLYDLPPLNLSSDSDSSDEEESVKKPDIDIEKPDEQSLEKEGTVETEPKIESPDETTTSSQNIGEDLPMEIPKQEDDLSTASSKGPQEPCESTTKVETPEDDTVDAVPPVTTETPETPLVDTEKPSTEVERDFQVEGIWENFYKTNPQNHNLPYPLCAMKSEVAYGIIMGDHDYCMQVKTDPVIKDDLPTSSNLETGFIDDKLEEIDMNTDKLAEPQTPTDDKKKIKSPKKKTKTPNENDNSSSSSDSSSDSDSSSCTCGTNCSCTSSSSNSSSSSSSESESSGGEDKEAKQERRRKKKERKLKPKPETPPPVVNKVEEDEEKVPEIDPTPRVPVDPPIQESELETDESSTDEEFYDKQPGKIANKIIAEKRNQLIMSVTPTVNNGSNSVETPQQETSTPTVPIDTTPLIKSKPKDKKRKRAPPKSKSLAEHQQITPVPMPLTPITPIPAINQFLPHITDNITPKTSFSAYEQQHTPASPSLSYQATPTTTALAPSTPLSDNDKSRSSKRRRIPNKFYGYSSGEEEEKPIAKWKKQPQEVTTSAPPRVQTPQSQPSPTPRIQLTVPKHIIRKPSYHKVQKTPKITIAPPQPPPTPPQPPPPPPPPSHPVLPPSLQPPQDSTESDSDDDDDEVPPTTSAATTTGPLHHPVPGSHFPPPHAQPPPPGSEPSSSKPEKDVYCYCRCPYDEVSEMIACDDETCPIEWFHFECVGILVPPRGQWFCPGCRKARGLPT